MKTQPISKTQDTPLQSSAKKPLDALHEYGDGDISRQERAEEGVRQYFRDMEKAAREMTKVDRKA